MRIYRPFLQVIRLMAMMSFCQLFFTFAIDSYHHKGDNFPYKIAAGLELFCLVLHTGLFLLEENKYNKTLYPVKA